MKTMTLEGLLSDLEKSASLEKVAAVTPHVAASAVLPAILEKKATEDLTTSAFAAGEALAKQLLTKVAADNEIQLTDALISAEDDGKVVPVSGGTVDQVLATTAANALARGATSDDIVDQLQDGQMKQAQHAKQAQLKSENLEMANAILNKIAQMVGEPTTVPAAQDSLGGAMAPNQIQMDNAQMVSYDDNKIMPMPGTEGTLNNILEAVVARAEGMGAKSEDLVNGNLPASEADEQEKVAAVDALVTAGFDFDSAISMVKEAEEALTYEADEMEKIAAVDELCAQGFDFDTAVELVKEAADEEGFANWASKHYNTAKETVKGWGGATKAKAQAAYNSAKAGAQATGAHLSAHRGKYGAGLGALAAGGAGYAAYHHHEKAAAVDELCAQGFDFDTAVELVKEAAEGEASMWDKVKGHAASAKEYANKQRHEFTSGVQNATTLGMDKNSKRVRKTGRSQLARNHIARGIGGLAAAGALGGAGYAAYRHHEKKAAFDALVESGVDFDVASDLVKQAEFDVYGQD